MGNLESTDFEAFFLPFVRSGNTSFISRVHLETQIGLVAPDGAGSFGTLTKIIPHRHNRPTQKKPSSFVYFSVSGDKGGILGAIATG
jgi:hypothetical protein